MVTGQEGVGMRYLRENCVAVEKMFFAVRVVNHEKLAHWSDGVTFEDVASQGPGSSPLRLCVLQKMRPVIFRGPWQHRCVLQGCTPVFWQILSRGLNRKCIVSSLTSRILSFPFCQVQGHQVQETSAADTAAGRNAVTLLFKLEWFHFGGSSKLKADLLNK